MSVNLTISKISNSKLGIILRTQPKSGATEVFHDSFGTGRVEKIPQTTIFWLAEKSWE